MNGIAPAHGGSTALLAVTARLVVVASALLGACRSEADSKPKVQQSEVPQPPARSLDVVVPAPDLPLGVPDLAALAWRERAGQEAFRRARSAERRADWPRMVELCQAALAADPSHLEASWLLAAGLARTARFSEVSAPLLRAVAGDPGKWAVPALQLELFAPFWASGAGNGLRPWLLAVLPRLEAMLVRSVILLHHGRLVAFDREAQRWLPLTRRLRGLGALIRRPWVVFVASRGARPGMADTQLGVVDLRTGAVQELSVPAAHRLEVVADGGATATAPSATPVEAPAVLVRVDGGLWQQLATDRLVAVAQPPPRRLLPRLQLVDGRVELERPPAAGIIADWDQARMASALRIRRSNRVVAVPTPALIDGQRLAWSPSAVRLAMVASLEDCERGKPTEAARRSLAYVVDPITGAAREVAQASVGLELEWVSDQVLAVASERGVELLDLAGGEPLRLDGDLSLSAPVRRSRCAEEPPAAPSRGVEDLDDL